MKLFSAEQIRKWDQYTIQHEPVASLELMERAASKCCEWILTNVRGESRFLMLCGPGNNGGDGLAIARLLIQKQYTVQVYILSPSATHSRDFLTNLERLQALTNQIELLEDENGFPQIHSSDIVIDALFGYGLNRPLEDLSQSLVDTINRSKARVISIDMPSGLFADKSSAGNAIVKADFTLSFQIKKLAFLLPENAPYMGDVQIMDIGLHPRYYEDTSSDFEIIEEESIKKFLPVRNAFSHKGNYGNALLIGGSYGMMGAVVLSSRACMRSGAGKLTAYIPACGYSILQTAVPEAMCVTDAGERNLTSLSVRDSFAAYAIGPGMGQDDSSIGVLRALFQKKPERLIIDADGLNLLSRRRDLCSGIPPGSILTPHPKEFERLFGSSVNDFERLEKALEWAKQLQCYIVLKGHYSFIATPGGKGYFNPTGNPGMATAGSGDVLTGILLGLYAQNSDPEQVVLSGVYLHGEAGDIASASGSEISLTAGDIIEFLPDAFRRLKQAII